MTTQDETTTIQSVKTSRPQFHSSNSHRSSSASHEFNSDYASEASSTTPAGYETPLSRISDPPLPYQPTDETEMTLPERPAAVAIPQPLIIRRESQQQNPRHGASLTISRTLESMSPPTPGVDDTPYIHFALEQISFDEDLAGRGRHSTNIDDLEMPRHITAESLGLNETPAPTKTTEQPKRPRQSFRFPSSSLERTRSRQRDVLLPVMAPDETKLGFVPIPLRPLMLALLVFLCFWMTAGLIFSNIHALRSHGLYDYDTNYSPRYFVFQYLPQMLGMVIILWLQVIQAAIYRVLPYFSLSTQREHDRVLQNMPLLCANFVLPDLRYFKLGEPLVGTILCIFWVMNITTPLLACLYQTQYYNNFETPRWRWATVQGVGWFLVALYFILVGALIICMLKFRSKRSALLWDPTSLADLVVLFRRSNILLDYEQSEVSMNLKAQLPPRYLRLGYWTPSASNEVFHTIGQPHAPRNRLSLMAEAGRQAHNIQTESDNSFDIEAYRFSGDSAFTRNIYSPFVRYRWCPWFLRDNAVLAWIIAAILLLIAFLVVSFVNDAVRNGWDPRLGSTTQANGFSPSNFLYSFLPSLLGMVLFLVWQPIDVWFRAVQPFANLAHPAGATAQRSLLQSYPAQPPLIVTFRALMSRDLKLAYITFISLLSTTIPVLSGGVCTAQVLSTGAVRMVASMPGYISLCVMLSIYALSYLFVWPTRKRYLPHGIDTIAEQLSYIYASGVMSDPSLQKIESKSDLKAKLTGRVSPIAPEKSMSDEKSAMKLTGDGRRSSRLRERYNGQGNRWIDRQLKYAFGIYVGRDSKEHLGIDRLQRPGSGEMLVITGMAHGRSSLGARSK